MGSIMKRTIGVLALLIFTLSLAPASAATGEDPGRPMPEVERLAGLCRLWGLVKFCHPYPATRGIDWDTALIETLPAVREAGTAEAYEKALASLFNRLGDPATFLEKRTRAASGAPAGTTSPLTVDRPQPYVEWTEDRIAVITATDYRQFSAENTGWVKVIADFKKAFMEAAGASRVLIDLRNLGGPYSYLLGMAVSDNLPRLLARDIALPPVRFLTYMGYPSQKEPTLYHAELATRSNGCLRALNPAGPAPDRIVILLNKDSLGLAPHLAALQDAGLAQLVHEGEIEPAAGIPTAALDLTDSLRARVRTSEILRRDGGPDLRPDIVVPADGRGAALAVLRGERGFEPSPPAKDPDDASREFSLIDRSYPEMAYPDREYRLLALFRFWNVIDRFFPYKELMDRTWDETLLEFIPRLDAAGDALEYALAIAELVARIQDSHGMIVNPVYDRYMGLAKPAVQVTFAEGLSVLSLIQDPALRRTGIDVGDIVLSVDGEKAEDRRARLKRFLPASTPGRLEAKADMALLAGDPDRPARVSFRKASGKVVSATLPRTREVPLRPDPSPLPNFTVLPEGPGYIDLGRLLDAEVGPALEKVKDTPGLVLDMRGYPIGGTFGLIARLARERKPFTLFGFPEFSGDSGHFSTREETGYVEPAAGHFDYKGRIAVLIHGSTQSAAEHTCLGLEAVADVTFIGSPTSGANGNITYAVLPGNIVVRFTGMSVRHADGRRLQRLGIQPHIRVEPTIEGIRSGRDEVLERAVEFLKTGRG